MKTYSECKAEEIESEFNAAYDDVRERFAGEDGSPEFIRREHQLYLEELEPDTQADKDWGVAFRYVKKFVLNQNTCPF